jgi:hypothetical protein
LKKVVAFLEGGEKGGQEKRSRKAVKKSGQKNRGI